MRLQRWRNVVVPALGIVGRRVKRHAVFARRQRWSKEPDVNELRRRILVLMNLIG